MHRLPTEEVFHLYLGGPVRMLQLFPDGSGREVVIGADILAGQQPQLVVPPGVWQGSRLEPGVEFALLGATMAPGFDYADYEAGPAGRVERAVSGICGDHPGSHPAAVNQEVRSNLRSRWTRGGEVYGASHREVVASPGGQVGDSNSDREGRGAGIGYMDFMMPAVVEAPLEFVEAMASFGFPQTLTAGYNASWIATPRGFFRRMRRSNSRRSSS